MAVPKSIAIYYAWPSAVNQTHSVPGAIAVFSEYDLVVLGAGLENTGHPDHGNTVDIINGTSSSTAYYGYIDSTAPFKSIKKQINRWCSMNVYGVLADQFGFDFGLTRQKQNKIVNYMHANSLCAMVNAWNPDDVFSTHNGDLPASTLVSGDWYLAQSHYVINGEWQNVSDWENKSNAMVAAQSSGVNMACITTTTTPIGFDQNKWNNAYYAHAVYDFNASGWGEPDFSASNALLPWRSRLAIHGTEFVGPLANISGVFQRQTNVGIQIDTSNNTAHRIIT